jgi:hypothetical protein
MILRTLLTLVALSPLTSYADPKWEASLGQTQMFVGGFKDQSLPLPTVSSTIILSRSLYEGFALWIIVNFPNSANKRLTKEGVVVDTHTPPVAMLGLSYNVFEYDYDETNQIGVDMGLSLGRTIDLSGQYFPVGAFRFKLLTGKYNTMYVGVTTSPYNMEGDMVWGVIYGLGHRF